MKFPRKLVEDSLRGIPPKFTFYARDPKFDKTLPDARPVIVTGGIADPRLANTIVREGWADLVGVGRAMLNDPDWARKAITELKESGERESQG